MPWNPENIFVTMLAFASPAQADLINHTYWAYIPNPPLLKVAEWTDIQPVLYLSILRPAIKGVLGI